MDTCYDVMVDIETTGTAPDIGAIIQIAAVKFNLQTRTVGPMFNRCLSIPKRRYWEEGTREFWGRQKPEILRDIYSRMEPAQTVMKDFGEWAGYSQEEPLRFWAKPTHFDYAFLQSYFNQFDIHNPFHYRYARDVNSYITGLALVSRIPVDELTAAIDFEGDAHNAIYDVLHQIKTVFTTTERAKPDA